jgi:copper(I)-binding protein
MTRTLRALVLAAFASLAVMPTAFGHEVKVGDLTISEMWTRATPGGAKVAGGYFTITNAGTAPDRLVSATSPASAKVEVHEMAMKDGVMTMRPLESGLAIAPGKSVTLAPGGFHLMLTDLKEPLKEGGLLPIDLTFEKAGKVQATLHIRGVGSKGPADDAAKAGSAGAMKGHDHKM